MILSEAKKRSQKKRKNVKHDPEANKVQVNLRMDAVLVIAIKEKAIKLGMPYQTLMQSVLHQHFLTSKSAFGIEAKTTWSEEDLRSFIKEEVKKIS